MWEFGNNLNWDLVLRRTYYAKPITEDFKSFIPIPTITATVDSHILLIGAKNPQAKPSWFLAGYAGSRLLFSPSSTSEFTAAVQSYPRVKLGLDRLTLVKFTNFDLLPYLLEINVARWHKEMFLEVWKYSGKVDDVDATVARIEEKLDTTSGQ